MPLTKETIMATDWHNDPATPPNLKPIEFGKFFQPVYPNGIQTFEVKTSEWTHVARASFGPGRIAWRSADRKSETKWTGDSHRYDIYSQKKGSHFGRAAWAIRFSHGGGTGWFVYEAHSETKSNPIEFAASLPEPQRWDFCNFLCESVERTACEAARDEFRKVGEAFIEGRLKKRRRNHTVRVEIVPKIAVVSR
jgi:hypothetical protein